MRERTVKKCLFFRICLNVNDYHFKTSKSSNKSIYANSMVSSNQNSTLDTEKLERKKHKYTTKKIIKPQRKSQKKKKKKKEKNRDEVHKNPRKQVIKW